MLSIPWDTIYSGIHLLFSGSTHHLPSALAPSSEPSGKPGPPLASANVGREQSSQTVQALPWDRERTRTLIGKKVHLSIHTPGVFYLLQVEQEQNTAVGQGARPWEQLWLLSQTPSTCSIAMTCCLGIGARLLLRSNPLVFRGVDWSQVWWVWESY